MIGRKLEMEKFHNIKKSNKSEFVVVLGRIRVGKTYLVRKFFKDKFAFYHTGTANAKTSVQLHDFNASLNRFGSVYYRKTKNWFDAFEQLIDLLSRRSKRSKKTVFIDEIPWMDTRRSGFIPALEHFWNGWASARKDIILIVCGSATSWIINKILKNRGELHNRVTGQIYLQPFTLAECEEYFSSQNIETSRREIMKNYMIFGGIPYYLSLMKKNFSIAQNIDDLLFSEQGQLINEFDNLYASLFMNSENHVKIVKALSLETRGLTREEIINITKIANGGNLTQTLNDLEQCGFIKKYNSLAKVERNALFQLCDFYTLFYFNFLKNNNNDSEHVWTNFVESGRYRTWSEYAFEQVCLAHVKQIKKALGISGVITKISVWRSSDKKSKTQIDLLIERRDNVINLCEIKYSDTKFVIDKDYDETLRNKRSVFKQETKTRKDVDMTMITTCGLKQTACEESIQSEVTIDDLFN